MSIIKRKKQDKFFIMSNHAPQENLTSLNSIGLLAYIKSLPEDWTLYKTFLQNKFTRRTVDSAWSELVEKNYIAGFCCYVDRKKSYYYLANDEPLTQEDFNEFLEETIEEIKAEGYEPKNIQPINGCNFTTVQNVHHKENAGITGNVQYVQYTECSTLSTVPDEHIQINTDKEIPQINNTNINNSVNTTQVYTDIINSLFLDLGEGLFNKNDIVFFTGKILEEVTTIPSNPESYFNNIVETIVHRRKKKLGIIPPPEVPFYNWLEA